MERWWNDADGGKLKYSEKNLSRFPFVYHKSYASAVKDRRVTVSAMKRPCWWSWLWSMIITDYNINSDKSYIL
jgi:hypothetical protein